jgi:hypothetical protein
MADSYADCRIFKTEKGYIGIRSIKPVTVDGKRLESGQFMPLLSTQLIRISEEDSEDVTEYEFVLL